MIIFAFDWLLHLFVARPCVTALTAVHNNTAMQFNNIRLGEPNIVASLLFLCDLEN
jgi:hypothetical protein